MTKSYHIAMVMIEIIKNHIINSAESKFESKLFMLDLKVWHKEQVLICMRAKARKEYKDWI